MSFEDILFYIFFVLMGCSLYKIAVKGFTGAMFGGKVEKTYHEIELQKVNITSRKLRIHRISSDNINKIGIEVVNKSLLGYQIIPVILSMEEAQSLSNVLLEASREIKNRSS